jgi:hypothetical protein
MKHLLLIIVLLICTGCSPEFWAGMSEAMEDYNYNTPTYSLPAPTPTTYGGYQSGNNGGYRHCGQFINGVRQCW